MKYIVLLFLLVICDHLPGSSSQDDLGIPADIVFLIDGSGSIGPSDFSIMKQFIIIIMEKLSNTDAQFSVVQYSTSVQPEFSFIDYRKAQKKETLVDRIPQLMGGTRTFSAIKFVT
uniref:VWFA domain-containing protein n=2 Tax=Callorhinchus milii TaxID=7868 RepID=A0A4W3K4L8_CALMI